MVKVKLYGNNTVLETVALCDEASSVTLVDKSIANRLGLDGIPQPLCIQWTNNLSSRHEDSSCLKFKISGIFSGAKMFSMKNVRTVENLALPVQEIRRSDWERYSHLEGIPFHGISERPMILLGQDNIHLTVARKVIQSTKNEPIATKTNLGWILHGGNSIEQEKQAYSFHICSSEISDISLHEMVKQSFTTDAFGVVPKKTNINKAEARAIDIMKSSDSTSFIADGSIDEAGSVRTTSPATLVVKIQQLATLEKTFRDYIMGFYTGAKQPPANKSSELVPSNSMSVRYQSLDRGPTMDHEREFVPIRERRDRSLDRGQYFDDEPYSSRSARQSPTSHQPFIGELQHQNSDLQRDLANLKKELELTNQKLGSSMHSIKTFWSPELKKERALRKEESAKYSLINDQLKLLSSENQQVIINVSESVQQSSQPFYNRWRVSRFNKYLNGKCRVYNTF
ncbi:hypothetical protein JTB14_017263 [Gonioctena quinquepunctata]|nr:hypothetical protein JTB14_017263 [Gonioctena quinquepunctata]